MGASGEEVEVGVLRGWIDVGVLDGGWRVWVGRFEGLD